MTKVKYTTVQIDHETWQMAGQLAEKLQADIKMPAKVGKGYAIKIAVIEALESRAEKKHQVF